MRVPGGRIRAAGGHSKCVGVGEVGVGISGSVKSGPTGRGRVFGCVG